MKVGDYVRTKFNILHIQRIGKIEEIISNDYVHTDIGTYIDEYVIKTNPNIKELIEVGDFVTYKKGNFYFNIPTRVCGLFDELTLSTVKMVGDDFLNEVEITSIVTKEQFEAMKYKVGVDKE